jgi:hypothetical protein
MGHERENDDRGMTFIRHQLLFVGISSNCAILYCADIMRDSCLFSCFESAAAARYYFFYINQVWRPVVPLGSLEFGL